MKRICTINMKEEKNGHISVSVKTFIKTKSIPKKQLITGINMSMKQLDKFMCSLLKLK
ncbi:MAG: hypothetical protein LBV22_01860 [Mycoplasmataceae bacterium]|nr:hypothetical protein [Mycoplasmataceae bacterium]